jgi:hypothetical protein
LAGIFEGERERGGRKVEEGVGKRDYGIEKPSAVSPQRSAPRREKLTADR